MVRFLRRLAGCRGGDTFVAMSLSAYLVGLLYYIFSEVRKRANAFVLSRRLMRALAYSLFGNAVLVLVLPWFPAGVRERFCFPSDTLAGWAAGSMVAASVLAVGVYEHSMRRKRWAASGAAQWMGKAQSIPVAAPRMTRVLWNE